MLFFFRQYNQLVHKLAKYSIFKIQKKLIFINFSLQQGIAASTSASHYQFSLQIDNIIIYTFIFNQKEMSKNSFSFLKGDDKQFDNAMKSIDSMYDNLFNGDKLDKIFQNLSYENNPITEPIDQMTKQIFSEEKTPQGPKYIKMQNHEELSESEFVVGEPLYPSISQSMIQNPYYKNQSLSENDESYFGQNRGREKLTNNYFGNNWNNKRN